MNTYQYKIKLFMNPNINSSNDKQSVNKNSGIYLKLS